jgi:hypothetical protein
MVGRGESGWMAPVSCVGICRENTMNLLLECANYSEPFLATFERIIKETVRKESNEEDLFSARLHAFLVMYYVTTGVPAKYVGDVMILIQKIKRNIVHRRFRREKTGVGIMRFRRHRLLAHLSITVQKICNLRKY